MEALEIGIEGRGRFVEQQHLRLDRHRPGDAQPLLLAAGEALAALLELVLHLVPQRRLGERPLHPLVHRRGGQLLVEPHAEGDVVVDRHRKRRRRLEDHADPLAQQVQVEAGVEDVDAVEQHLAGRPLAGVELVDPVETTEQGRLAAARRPDEGGHPLRRDHQVDALEGLVAAVEEVEVAGDDLGVGRLGQRVPGGGRHRQAARRAGGRAGRRRRLRPGSRLGGETRLRHVDLQRDVHLSPSSSCGAGSAPRC